MHEIPSAHLRCLLIGLALFCIGWGLVGYRPGPAVASCGIAISNRRRLTKHRR
jgi:hypothetical protein